MTTPERQARSCPPALADYVDAAGGRPQTAAATPDWVAAIIRDAILDNALAPGAPARQDTIAAALGVSKIPVREALRRLEAEGLVRFERNRGVLVTDLSLDEAREIFSLRLALERVALERALPNLTDDDFATAAAVLDEEASATDIGRVGDINWRFHRLLYGPGMGPHLRTILSTLLRLSERYVRLHLSRSDARRAAHDEHVALLAACRAGDRDHALNLLDDHLTKAIDRLSRHL